MSLALLRPKVVNKVRDQGGVLADPADINTALEDAVRRYSRVKPRAVVEDVAGTGAFDYPLPATWSTEWSRLEEVEYPAGRRDPEIVDRLDWKIYDAPGGPQLRFRYASPAVGETVRIRFTGLHTIVEGSTTVPVADHDVLVLLAAALGCEEISSYYSNASDPSLLADAVDHKSKASEYAQRAKRFMQLANELLPVQEQGDVRAAGGETSMGEDVFSLTHPTR